MSIEFNCAKTVITHCNHVFILRWPFDDKWYRIFRKEFFVITHTHCVRVKMIYLGFILYLGIERWILYLYWPFYCVSDTRGMIFAWIDHSNSDHLLESLVNFEPKFILGQLKYMADKHFWANQKASSDICQDMRFPINFSQIFIGFKCYRETI